MPIQTIPLQDFRSLLKEVWTHQDIAIIVNLSTNQIQLHYNSKVNTYQFRYSEMQEVEDSTLIGINMCPLEVRVVQLSSEIVLIGRKQGVESYLNKHQNIKIV